MQSRLAEYIANIYLTITVLFIETKILMPCSQFQVDSYAYLPPNFEHSIESDASATIVVFERRFVLFTSPFYKYVSTL